MGRLALISLHDTHGLAGDARRLLAFGYELLASAESSAILRSAGLPVIELADFTGLHDDFGFPPTLHPKIEFALTGDADDPIELAYVHPYPAESGNDVGGRTLLMLAVKGKRHAVSCREDLLTLLDSLEGKGPPPETIRKMLADKACSQVARHFAGLIEDEDPTAAPNYAFLGGGRHLTLAEGENPYQTPAAAYADEKGDPLALSGFRQLSGNAPCFTNLADADAVIHTLGLLAEGFDKNLGSTPWFCVAAKHGNPCGVGISSESPRQAIDRALAGNPRAIWGGEVAVNFPIDGALAQALFASDAREARFGQPHWMLDIILAPAFSTEAIEILGRRDARKLLANPALARPRIERDGRHFRQVRGGLLSQPHPTYILDLESCETTGLTQDAAAVGDLIVAWAVAFSSNLGGNEVAIARDGMLLGAGGGPSTVDAANTALQRCRDQEHDCGGASFAADAFFPYTDAPALLADAGVVAGCVPLGARQDAQVREFLASRKIAMAYLPPHIRGFCRH